MVVKLSVGENEGGIDDARIRCQETTAEIFRKIVDCFIVMKSPACRVHKVEVTEEYGSEPQKPVRCEVSLADVEERKKEQNVPREFPGAGGGYEP